MMNKVLAWPIRIHLTILIVLLAVPSISLIVYSGMGERREAKAAAKAECLKFVNEVAGRQAAIVTGAEQLGTALATLPAIRSRNPAAATALFSELLKENPQYANIAVCDRSGLVWASATPLEEKVSLADRRFVQQATRTGRFSSGEYAMGKITKKPVVGFGYPVKNSSNDIVAIIVVTLDLGYIQHIFETLDLPPYSAFNLLDHGGTILAMNSDNPNVERFLGRRDPRPDAFNTMREGPEEGTFEAVANDGRFRLAAYRKLRLAHESTPYLYIRSSIPLSSAIAQANAAMVRNLSVFATLFLVGLALALFIGKRVILKPVMMLKGASERLAAGARTVNVSDVVKGGELGELARTFDAMAEALVQRESSLRESEEWLALAAGATQIGMFDRNLTTGRILWTQAHEAIFGYSPVFTAAAATTTTEHDIRRWSDRVHPEDLPLVEEEARHCMQDRLALEMEYRIIWPDGSLRWVETRGVCLYDGDSGATRMLGVVMDITERRKAEDALRSTNEELERFNRVAVGRESRMIELKKQINELCVKAGLPIRYPMASGQPDREELP